MAGHAFVMLEKKSQPASPPESQKIPTVTKTLSIQLVFRIKTSTMVSTF